MVKNERGINKANGNENGRCGNGRHSNGINSVVTKWIVLPGFIALIRECTIAGREKMNWNKNIYVLFPIQEKNNCQTFIFMAGENDPIIPSLFLSLVKSENPAESKKIYSLSIRILYLFPLETWYFFNSFLFSSRVIISSLLKTVYSFLFSIISQVVPSNANLGVRILYRLLGLDNVCP